MKSFLRGFWMVATIICLVDAGIAFCHHMWALWLILSVIGGSLMGLNWPKIHYLDRS
jgi:hypothetical protein